MLFRFREQQAAELGIVDAGRTRRPRVISEVQSVAECEKWRTQVVREIGHKVNKINDPSLNEPQIRDLNDEINKLMREKHVWELRIKELGGPNYLRFASKMFDAQGRELPSTRGYKYFGRARELPGVKELFEAETRQRLEDDASRAKMYAGPRPQDLTPEYFGFGEKDKELLDEEAQFSEARKRDLQPGPRVPDYTPLPVFKVPTPGEMESYLVERKKQQLEQKYLE
jgi:pre-mRNA-splicing factor ISY1